MNVNAFGLAAGRKHAKARRPLPNAFLARNVNPRKANDWFGKSPRPAPYGGKALGRVTFTADGRMMSVVCDGRKELPAGVAREYSSYCGDYIFDGERLVTRVDAASDPTRIGSDQVRGVRFVGERMVLVPPPRQTGESENTGRLP